jgi:predicted transcriptional regulator|tara:strand:- start:40 stop:255 length:216 start_codon:yes stop_codon:yes gene_type:complete
MKRELLDALRARYEAQIAEADATIKIYLENSVGIGEHPQHIEEIDKQLQKIADAQEKLRVIEDFEPERSVL